MSAITPVLPLSPGLMTRVEAPAPGPGIAPPATAARVETARAVMPVAGGREPADLRFVDRDGRPVGPPPAFQVSVLEARRQAALQPIPPRTPSRDGDNAPFAPLDLGSPAEQVDRKL